MDKDKYREMLQIAIEEAEQGLAEGGIPIGAALFDENGLLLGRGHNRRVQEDDPSAHAETDAFRKAGRRRSYRSDIMVTTLAPCWYCSGRAPLTSNFVVGESVNFSGGIDWLRESDIDVVDLDSRECVSISALRTAEGKIYTGCNIESASYGLTVCAERVAIWKALSECERDFTDLVVVVDTEQLTPPCGTCRQIIWEYCKEAKITLANLKSQRQEVDIADLLPRAFDARFLNETSSQQK